MPAPCGLPAGCISLCSASLAGEPRQGRQPSRCDLAVPQVRALASARRPRACHARSASPSPTRARSNVTKSSLAARAVVWRSTSPRSRRARAAPDRPHSSAPSPSSRSSCSLGLTAPPVHAPSCQRSAWWLGSCCAHGGALPHHGRTTRARHSSAHVGTLACTRSPARGISRELVTY